MWLLLSERGYCICQEIGRGLKRFSIEPKINRDCICQKMCRGSEHNHDRIDGDKHCICQEYGRGSKQMR